MIEFFCENSYRLTVHHFGRWLKFKVFRFSMLTKALGICTERFCIRADFLHEARWWERHPICKISLINFAFRALRLFRTASINTIITVFHMYQKIIARNIYCNGYVGMPSLQCFIVMFLLQCFQCNGFRFSPSPMFTNKATIYRSIPGIIVFLLLLFLNIIS